MHLMWLTCAGFLASFTNGSSRRSLNHLRGLPADCHIPGLRLSCPWLDISLGETIPFRDICTMVANFRSLGDRHCENILLDSNNGDVVHVDFNCLFERVSIF